MSSLAERLRDLRRSRALTQAAVARAAGVDRSHLSKIETGVDTPGRAALTGLASFYGVSMDWLLTGQERVPEDGARACSEEEVLLLACWRALPRAEAVPLLDMLRKRVAGLAPEPEG
ncbi:helix-turn-helix domain-containing protein [Acidisoma sp. 7E03]